MLSGHVLFERWPIHPGTNAFSTNDSRMPLGKGIADIVSSGMAKAERLLPRQLRGGFLLPVE